MKHAIIKFIHKHLFGDSYGLVIYEKSRYAVLIFDSQRPPAVGDTIEIGGLRAEFRNIDKEREYAAATTNL